MEEIFTNIMERIAGGMPELSLIDEDYGQLEMSAEEDRYPVTFPCVLIGNIDADWRDQGLGNQKGAALITVRLGWTAMMTLPLSPELMTRLRIDGKWT